MSFQLQHHDKLYIEKYLTNAHKTWIYRKNKAVTFNRSYSKAWHCAVDIVKNHCNRWCFSHRAEGLPCNYIAAVILLKAGSVAVKPQRPKTYKLSRTFLWMSCRAQVAISTETPSYAGTKLFKMHPEELKNRCPERKYWNRDWLPVLVEFRNLANSSQ